MPGLVGFTDKFKIFDTNMLLSMRSLLKHYDWYFDEELYSDNHIFASRTHLGLKKQGKQPQEVNDSIFSWMEGEFYNQEELKAIFNIESDSDFALLVAIYKKKRSFDFLRDIDGIYAAVIYDKQESTVHLISDRYGFKPLFWGIINDNLVWSSELKGFLGHKGFKINIDGKAIQQFFDSGYLLENRTWFDSIEIVPPSSVLSFDIINSKTEINHYWSWCDIKPIEGNIDEREIAEELGRLFKQAVRKRVNKGERIGITLSGGLDSRAILAAVPEDFKPLHTFTFGQNKCDDIRIAKTVSGIKSAEHHTLTLHSNNWLMSRIGGIWKSDGAFSLLHMHGMEFYDKYKQYIDFNLDGIWGDVIGGLYINLAPNQPEEYTARNRGRRFINQALILGESSLIHRRPFTSNDLIELAFSFPKTLRQDSYIYKKMLLETFPEYYNNIPWQKTGYPISYNGMTEKLIVLKNFIINKLKRESRKIGVTFKDKRDFTDYASWIRKEPAISFFQKVLLSKDAIYPEYIDMNGVHTHFRNHMDKKGDFHNELCLDSTFELWLQQIFEGKYRG